MTRSWLYRSKVRNKGPRLGSAARKLIRSCLASAAIASDCAMAWPMLSWDAPYRRCIASLREGREHLRHGPRREIEHLGCGLDRESMGTRRNYQERNRQCGDASDHDLDDAIECRFDRARVGNSVHPKHQHARERRCAE